jgi:hypothetical protein
VLLKIKSIKLFSLVLGIVMIPSPAFAAGSSYTFGAKFKHLLDSGAWDQKSGTDSYSFTCTSGFGQQYSVTLFKNSIFGDDSKGSKTFTCDSSVDTASWSGLNSGKYHLSFSKSQNNIYIVGSGSISHP